MDYKRKRLQVGEAFSGYGSHSLQLTALGIRHKVKYTMEIDVDAIISYAGVHDLTYKLQGETMHYMRRWLKRKGIGWDFKQNKSKITNMHPKKVEQVYIAARAQNCLGDISKIDMKKLPRVEVFTYSFQIGRASCRERV